VFVFFGLVAVAGTYYVQGLTWPPDAFLAGVALGALNTSILVVNNLRDINTDTVAGKRTLAVRLGATGTRVEYLLMLVVAFIVPLVGWRVYQWPVAVLSTLVVLPLCMSPLKRVFGFSEPVELLPALGETARVVVVFALFLGLALAYG